MADIIRVTVVMEYEPDAENYNGASSIAEMAALDETLNPFREYPDAYFEDIVSVTYEGITTHV
ncbi:hypothetical protein [Streptomyces sp. NPDC058861]|uniref:hypothetical protein n=1 Tax=Streptomyces sp. NPDC058861 TaxID=3346653 RepID=UPI0036B57D50